MHSTYKGADPLERVTYSADEELNTGAHYEGAGNMPSYDTGFRAFSPSRRRRVRIEYDFEQAASSTIRPPWSTQDTSAAGSPTLDFLNDVANGEFQLKHDAQSEAQNLTLYWGDQLMIDPTKNPIIEFLAKINFAGATFSADQRLVMGLASARNATLDSITHHAWFRIEGANLNILVEGDDGTTDTNDQDSGIDIVDNVYTRFRIDMSDLTKVKFYVDGVEQTGAAVDVSAMAATNLLQPFFEIQRDAGVEAEDFRIDYAWVEYDR